MNIDARPSVIFLMGPTASGKTALAVALSQQFNLEIVSVDSAMVYRGFNIGAAKPTAEILKRSPHALIDIRDPNQSYSAAEFRNDALYEMERIRKTWPGTSISWRNRLIFSSAREAYPIYLTLIRKYDIS